MVSNSRPPAEPGHSPSKNNYFDMTADERFQAALERRSLTYRIDDDGPHYIQIRDISARINLDNVRRNQERDNDADAIERSTQQLDGDMFGDQPPQEDVSPFLRDSLAPSDYAMGFDGPVRAFVTDELVKVFIVTPPDRSRISWITQSRIADWRVSKDDVIALASEKMDQLVRETKLEVQQAGDVELGMLSLADIHIKASLILLPQFKSFVSSVHGWPVFVVAPARDFVYVLSQGHRNFLGRLGSVVLREYPEAGYPVTADVLEVSDTGNTPIGSFTPRSS